jgi:small subunit ribosomal protein S20
MFWNILARSSSGPGRRPFTAETRVRFPYGSQLKTKIKDMANHKSALKRIRQTAKRAAHNRYYHKTTRNAVRKLRGTTDAGEAAEMFHRVASMLDKLAKRNIIHKKKASNLKSSLAKHVAAL